ncbi:MAG: hypothetical protein OXS28_08600 [Gammaproteobacteria bacterium]|nr:hypothetical protein [Gammaproteobacteria bacterium]MDE0283569.1 hypothetical protein [Gammaproteobacteria bacterium]
MRSLRRLLLGACVCLAGYSVYEWTRPYAPPDTAPPASRDASALMESVIATTPDLPPIETFAETLERPLFRADRRPYEAPQPVIVDEPAPAPVVEIPLGEQVALRATIIIGEKRIALLHDLVNDIPLRLSRGDDVHGWTLSEVDTDSVVLQNGEARARLALKQE